MCISNEALLLSLAWKWSVLFPRLFSSRCLILQSTHCKKVKTSSLFFGSTPSLHVIFHLIWLFSTNDNVTENNLLRKLGNFSAKFYDGVSFSKGTILQSSDCNFTIKRTHHRFFLEYVPKPSLKKNKKRKSCFFFIKKVYGGLAS